MHLDTMQVRYNYGLAVYHDRPPLSVGLEKTPFQLFELEIECSFDFIRVRFGLNPNVKIVHCC